MSNGHGHEVGDTVIIDARRAAVRAIVESRSLHKVIVAGPGTGKTYTFGVLLRSRDGDRLVLTFVRSLVADLEASLHGVAEVMTFHKFARWQLHKHGADGLTANFDYFPLLADLQAEDGTILSREPVGSEDVKRALHLMEAGDVLNLALRSGTYYDAVGFDDSVYRIVRHFDNRPDAIPRFVQVVVDEYQDFNPLEVALIRQVASTSPTLIVGDDDQALYQWKQATPEFLRGLTNGDEYESFELPYCSRCTDVIVAGVHWIVERAQARGNLQGRVEKRFECYTPDKRPDSERYPRIIHAAVTVDRKDRPYIAQYIERAIEAIPPEDVAESWSEGYPTVLVIGRPHFASAIHGYLEDQETPNLLPWDRNQLGIELLEGHVRLADDERSRLGWRIVMYMDPPNDRDEILRACIEGGAELAELLPDDYKEPHLGVARLVRKISKEELLTPEQEERARALALDAERIRAIRTGVDEESSNEPDEPPDRTRPSIRVTTLDSAKGLQAAHVFVAGVNDHHFPKVNARPTDHEVCLMLVALTRATKCCQVISCRRPFGGEPRDPGVFIGWLDGLTERVNVNADYFRA